MNSKIRFFTQFIFLLIAPAYFSSAFAGVKQFALELGRFDFSLISFSYFTLIFLVLVIYTAIFSRFFCGFCCAFGTYNDVINAIARRLHIPQRSFGKMRYCKYVVLVLILGICFSGNIALLRGSSPWDVFGQFMIFRFDISGYVIGFILLIAISVGAMFCERFFCRYLCPLGSIFSLVGRLPRVFAIKKADSKCGACSICTSRCSMGIELNSVEKIRDGECISCGKCVSACSRGNFMTEIFGIKTKNLTFFAFQCIIMLILIFCFN